MVNLKLKLVFVLTFIFLLIFSTGLSAEANSLADPSEKGKISVVVFLDRFLKEDNQCLEIVKKSLNDKFNGANIAIYGDNSSKSPEYLEFIEKLQSDPANEKGIRIIPTKYLYKYGKDTNASHVVLMKISSVGFDVNIWSNKTIVRIKQEVTVLSVEPNKIVLNNIFDTGEKLKPFREALQLSMNQLKNEFKWTPQSLQESEVKPVSENRVAVLAFLPRKFQMESELYLKVKDSIAEKIKDADITVFNDFQAKSPEYMEFIGNVLNDSAVQKAFIVKKDHAVKYGADAGYRTVVVFKLSITDEDAAGGLSFGTDYRLKEDISIIDVELNKYLANYVFDTEKRMRLNTALDTIISKFKNEFTIPSAIYMAKE